MSNAAIFWTLIPGMTIPRSCRRDLYLSQWAFAPKEEIGVYMMDCRIGLFSGFLYSLVRHTGKPIPRLTKEQRESLFAPLFKTIKADLQRASGGDLRLLWALRRKLTKELGYLERSTPAERNALKSKIWNAQNGRCALCEKRQLYATV